MKGVIVNCLAELVQNKFSKDAWENILTQNGLSKDHAVLPSENVDDAVVMKVVGTTCSVLGISLDQAADAFGDYWVNTFAPRLYSAYYRNAKNAREFLLKMDWVHEQSTQNIPGATPPRFDYQWLDDNTLVMTYKSPRGLIDFLVGLIKGVGTYFREELVVTKIGADKVQVKFPAAAKQ